jgi:hypothetical protein
LQQARAFAGQLQGAAPKLNVAELDNIIAQFNSLSHNGDATNAYISNTLGSQTTTVRGEYSATLHQYSKRAGEAYDLGVAISIAEAQASAGNAGRQIILSSLENARTPATRLGFPVKDITDIITQLNKGAGIDSLYNQITYLRGKFQGLF